MSGIELESARNGGEGGILLQIARKSLTLGEAAAPSGAQMGTELKRLRQGFDQPCWLRQFDVNRTAVRVRHLSLELLYPVEHCLRVAGCGLRARARMKQWSRKKIMTGGLAAVALIGAVAALLHYFEPATVNIEYDHAGRCSGEGPYIRVTISNYHFRPLASTIVGVRAFREGFSKNLVTTFDWEPKGVAFRYQRIIPPFAWNTHCRSLSRWKVDGDAKSLVWSGFLYQSEFGSPY